MINKKTMDDVMTNLIDKETIDEKTIDDVITNLIDKEMLDEKTIDSLMVRIVGKDWKTMDLDNLPHHERMRLVEKAYALGWQEGVSSRSNN